jgi:hypothetical protein
MASAPTTNQQEVEIEPEMEVEEQQSTPDFYIFDPETSDIEPESDEEEFPEDFPDYVEQGVITQDEIMINNKREDTRGRLAVIYVAATFLMFILGFVVSVIDAAWRNVSVIENLRIILPLLSGIFLGTLGFVLGYYFRKSESDPV